MADMLFSNKGEKVSMGYFKEFEIGFINILRSHIGSKKGRNIVGKQIHMKCIKITFKKYNIPSYPHPRCGKRILPTVSFNLLTDDFY